MGIQYRRWRWHAALLMLILLLSACKEASAEQPARREALEHFAAKPTPTVASVDNPVSLLIPAIQVNTAIEEVGILANGDLATPQQQPLKDVGWYNVGPRPGEQGSAVIDGHLDGPGSQPAVFWDLHKLQPGDEIIVGMSSGKTLHFHVNEVTSYAPKDAPLQRIFGDQSGISLNLITCAGVWIPSEQQTTLRTVVYTSLA